ncbi:MAG: hypothetical protein AB2747_22060 [Candidatus Thiodiazotropha taylori]|nr:hypothetical protein [Candidatus Thiodiazotropha endolucinida]MCG8041373.1 hypothetical protein [Candidatus Thiodiazotropha taylori]MCG8055215.1 hypothetical protein [Candidatus Thiodiazotropha taylori]MCW4230533.1 hypothetical protein [Candidatus Thiodiazotropha taylori]MCW4242199.1 hypothetical protein [Candidatus Thiodiazotropha taylori]
MVERKPNTQVAMRQLIEQIRTQIPFDLSEEERCGESCEGCSGKLLIYLESELDEWQIKLDQGVVPSFADLSRLAAKAKKIVNVLRRNGLMPEEASV